MIGNGTRQWEVRHHPFLDKERHEGPALPQHCTCLPPESMGMTSWVPAQSINPTLLLTAFLPVLLFGAASVLEYHTARRLMWSSLLLAGARRWPLPLTRLQPLREDVYCVGAVRAVAAAQLVSAGVPY